MSHVACMREFRNHYDDGNERSEKIFFDWKPQYATEFTLFILQFTCTIFYIAHTIQTYRDGIHSEST